MNFDLLHRDRRYIYIRRSEETEENARCFSKMQNAKFPRIMQMGRGGGVRGGGGVSGAAAEEPVGVCVRFWCMKRTLLGANSAPGKVSVRKIGS